MKLRPKRCKSENPCNEIIPPPQPPTTIPPTNLLTTIPLQQSPLLTRQLVPHATQPPTTVPLTIQPLMDCGGPGWTRITYLNMSDPAQKCPSPWTESSLGNKRTCFQSSSPSKEDGACDSVMYSNSHGEYSQVCGCITGYQYGQSVGLGFFHYTWQGYSIDSYYVGGISVTHGRSPRQHIWTFAAGIDETDTPSSCPCGTTSHNQQAYVPPYIGNNYFCETGTIQPPTNNHFYPDDPLWDGEGCGPGHSCECTLHNPPWFTAQLTIPTNDDIEVRGCSYLGTTGGNVGIEFIELYIK